MDLDSMKYAELQSLAKSLGLKANMKAEKLLKLIKQHYQSGKTEEAQAEEQDVTAVNKEENAAEAKENKDAPHEVEVSKPEGFVNTRRGRQNGPKRKISDSKEETVCDAQETLSAAEGDTEVTSDVTSAKRRRVSSTKDSPQNELQTSDQKENAPVPIETKKTTKATKAGKIPRLKGQKDKPQLKAITPNFKKLHEAHFKKMESIDSYVQRKNKQMDTLKSSAKELKTLSDKTKLQKVEDKPPVKGSRGSLFSPVPMNKKAVEERRRHTMLSASKAAPNKAAGKEAAPFRPSVLSTRRINVRFSEATHDNEYKKSMVKTPARMSPCVASSTPLKPAADEGKPKNAKTSFLSAAKTPVTFVFTGNTSTSTTPGTQKKSNFDLKASLARPLTYKPHTGKLKPFGETAERKEMASEKKSEPAVPSHQKNYKQHQVKTREDRRAKHVENRKQKKESVLGARRGLVMV